ncbi:hypothetical protein ATKI12_0207 [Kitasatospora sp. Ki12]
MPDQDQPQTGDVLVDMTPVVPTPPPPPGSRRRLWLTLTVSAVAAVTALATALAHDTTDVGAYRYSPPEDFLGLPSVPAERIPRAPTLPSDVKVSGYQTSDKSRTVSVAVRELPIVSPSAVFDRVVTEATSGAHVTGLSTADPGERGGVMKCGHMTATRATGKTQDLAFCVWVDGSMWGLYFEHKEDVTLDADTPADDARTFRHLAEVRY